MSTHLFWKSVGIRVKRADSDVERRVGEGGKGVAEAPPISVCRRPAPLRPPWGEALRLWAAVPWAAGHLALLSVL